MDETEDQQMEDQPTISEENSQNGVCAENEDKIEEGSLIKAGCDDEGKIFVGGLNWETKTKGLREYFTQFGEVKDCCIKEDSVTKKSRGFGFVLFSDPESVKRVLDEPVHRLDNRKIDPKRAKALKKEFKLFAGGFSPDVTDEQLKVHFSAFGEIELLERPTEKPADTPRGFCFITYKTEKAVIDACKTRFQEIQGKRSEVKMAETQRDRGRGRQNPGYGYSPNYYQGGWNSQPSWNPGFGGGYGDFGYGPGGYGNFSGNWYGGQGGGGGGYGQSAVYGNYYQGYGGGNYGYSGNYQGGGGGGGGCGGGGYGQGQQQMQPQQTYGKTARRGGGQNTYKPY